MQAAANVAPTHTACRLLLTYALKYVFHLINQNGSHTHKKRCAVITGSPQPTLTSLLILYLPAMAPSNTSSATGRPTRTSARTPAKPVSSTSSTQASADTTAEPPAATPSKRQATRKADIRKRTKVADSEDDQEEEDEGDEGEEEDQYDDESDMDDFEDTSYGAKGKNKPNRASTKASRSSSSVSKPTSSKKKSSSTPASTSSPIKSSTVKSTNPDLLPAPSKTFLISPLVIPRPKKPVADAIQPETLEFMRDLKLNNDREYFQLNEARWLAAKLDFQDFIRMVKEGLLEGDPDVMDQEPKDSMMRI